MLTVVPGRAVLTQRSLSMVGNQSLTTAYPPLTSAVPVVTVNCLNQSEKFTGLWGFLSSHSACLAPAPSGLELPSCLQGCDWVVLSLQAPAGFSLHC